MKKLFLLGVLGLVSVVSVFPVQNAFAAMSGSQNNGSIRCTWGREAMKISVDVESFVYAHDNNENRRNEPWTLWAANVDAWIWDSWGGTAIRSLNHSWSKNAQGFICAKWGDDVRINGVFDHGTKYLVYNSGKNNNAPADQIQSITIGGKSYSIGKGKDCVWRDNGKGGGYDMQCRIK